MRAFLYCRVAHDDSFALEHQRFLLQLYAKQAGYTIIGAADEYGSGLTLDRPAIQKVTEAVVAGRVDVVLVHSLTRIGREWGMTQSYICRILRSYKDTPHGPSGETRTPGILLPKQARYQLRYTRLLSCFIRLGVFSQASVLPTALHPDI